MCQTFFEMFLKISKIFQYFDKSYYAEEKTEGGRPSMLAKRFVFAIKKEGTSTRKTSEKSRIVQKKLGGASQTSLSAVTSMPSGT